MAIYRGPGGSGDATNDATSKSIIASNINITDSGGYYTSSKVEGALQEAATFTQSGTGAILRTKTDKLKEFVSVLDFGAVGDGVTDDTAAIQNALNYGSANNKTVTFTSGKTYKITSKLTGSSNLRVEGYGATLDMSGISSGAKTAIEVTGSAGTGQAITSGASVNSYTIGVASTSSFAVGDYVLVTSGDFYDYGGGSYNVSRGEVVKIRFIVTNTSISFTTPLTDTYTTSPVVRPVTWVSNVHIKGLKIVGADQVVNLQRGIAFRYVKDFSITDCELINQNTYQIEVAGCIRGCVSNNTISGVFYNGTDGTIFYGVSVMDSTQWVDVERNIGDRNRHLVVTTARTSGQGFYGQPRWVNVRGNIMNDAMSGGGGRSFAYENHGFGQFVNWIGNQANGCYSLIRLEQGTDNVVSGNICNGYGFQGIIVGSSGAKIRNLVISGNTIKNYTGEVTAGLPCGIRLDTCAELINVSISGNTFERVTNGSNGQGISVGASTTMSNIVFSSNVIRAGDAESTVYAISLASGCVGMTFTGNVIYGFRAGYNIQSSCANIIVQGGRVENFSTGATGFGFYSNGSKCVCFGVHFRNINTAIRLDTLSANCLTTANTMDGVTTTTPSNAGTANTTTGNFAL